MSFASVYFFLVLSLPIFGILLNGYVFWRITRLARRRRSRFECTSALPLAAMSAGDSVTLLALFIQALFHKLDKSGIPPLLLNAICKIDLFSMHSTSAFSVWCWLLLSILRCVAVFKPLNYYTIWRQPRNALMSLALLCVLFQSWILLFVVYSEEGRICLEDKDISQKLIKIAHTTDIMLFYAIPSAMRLILDTTVLFHCYSPFTSIDATLVERRLAISIPVSRKYSIADDTVAVRQSMALMHSFASDEQTSKKRALYLKRKTALIMRSIGISVLNLLLNLPAYILRVWNTFGDVDQNQQDIEAMQSIEPICHLLYFSQFACNAFYLSIYESTSYTQSNRSVSGKREGRVTGENGFSSHA